MSERKILEIIDVDQDGQGIAKLDNKVYFIKNALTSEIVEAKIIKSNKNFSFAKTSKVIKSSIYREEPKCIHYYECGGCDFMHANYDFELLMKKNKVRNTFKKIADLDINVLDTVKNNNIYGYRNKVLIPFEMKNEEIIYGFYKEKSHEIVEISDCLIENKFVKSILIKIKELLNKYKISIYNEIEHKGLFKAVMIRSTSFNRLMIVLVTTKINSVYQNIALELHNTFDNIDSIMLNINPEKTNVVLSYDYINLYGNNYIEEEILNLKFQVGASSFLQINHSQTNKLYDLAINLLNINKEMTVIDAYCGIGTITLALALKAKHVYGIEIVEEAIKNANNNKELNNITNATFICGKCEDEIEKIVKDNKIDAILFDPPRKGADRSFLETIVKTKIKRIVYISCKVSSCARDVKYLIDNNYEVKKVIPVDLFSRTTHVECICSLALKTNY